MTFNYWKRKISDRYDGWRVTKVDTLFSVIPHILRTRLDSQVYYEEKVPIDEIEGFIRKHKADMPGLSVMHIIIAALVRVFSQRPRLNRFVVHNKIYARNSLSVCLTAKRSLTEDGDEAVVKLDFDPSYTLDDVVRKVHDEFEKCLPQGQQNNTDSTARFLSNLPQLVLRIAIGALRVMDKFGWLPKSIHDASPWHCSLYLTNMGSLGAESVYHHLYEFGTCSLFISMGKKSYSHIPDEDGNMVKHKSILLRCVIDERICDGYYYASSMRLLGTLLSRPGQLLIPPSEVVLDDGVDRKRI